VITLTLLHPIKNTPVQSWTFEHESVIRMGRATDNHVVLYSAVVSRRHVELLRTGTSWEIVNLGANGTFLDGERVNRLPAHDGLIVRLARSGPSIQVSLASPVAAASSSPSKPDIPATTPHQELVQTVESETPDMPAMMATSVGVRGFGQELNPDLTSDFTTVLRNKPISEHDNTIAISQNKISGEPIHFEQPIDEPVEGNDIHTEELLPLNHSSQSLSSFSSVEDLPNVRQNLSQPLGSDIISFSLETGQPLQILQMVGRYQIVKVLVQSSNSITYIAWRDGRSLALKTLNANWMDYQEACSMLEQEARLLNQFRHPGLPQLIDFFWVEGQPYLAREMIYGQSLDQYVAANGPLSQRQALSWLIQVCDVLNHLHQQKPAVIHYDVKPTNIIRRANPQGSWEIGVVGMRVAGAFTEVGTHMGFPAYTAPEQQEGHPVPVSDLYSLGPLLLYLLTGQDPEMLYRYADNEYRLAPEEIPLLGSGVVNLIRTLTEPKPELRYPSAKDVIKALQQMLNGTPAHSRFQG
jgi:hypothetical protein